MAAPLFTPVRLLDVELADPLPVLDQARALDGRPYRRARLLVRLHGRPLGGVDLDLGDPPPTPGHLGRRIWGALAGPITAHRLGDGDPTLAGLPEGGLGPGPGGRCPTAPVLDRPPPASVVVATRDRPDALVACVDRLLELTYPRFEVLVVDNAPSSPATERAVGSRYGQLANVRYLREDRPGLSNARNHGLREAGGEIVAFTDDDVLVDPDWLTNLVAAFGVAPHVACTTGLILPAELETAAQAWLEQYGGFAKGYTRRLFDMGQHRVPEPLYPYTMGQFGSGASLAFRASTLRELDGFAADLGAGTRAAGGEDLDIFFRVLMRGGAIVFEPGAVLRHAHRRDDAGLRRQLHGYGVGLAAALTKCLVDHPARVLEVAVRLPRGLAYLLAPGSAKNHRKRDGFPAELTLLELAGLLAGPGRYLRSRREARRARPIRSQPST